jgi:hypothetical protein
MKTAIGVRSPQDVHAEQKSAPTLNFPIILFREQVLSRAYLTAYSHISGSIHGIVLIWNAILMWFPVNGEFDFPDRPNEPQRFECARQATPTVP